MENDTPREHTDDYMRARAHMDPDIKKLLKKIDKYITKAKEGYYLAENDLYKNPEELLRDLLIERLQDLG